MNAKFSQACFEMGPPSQRLRRRKLAEQQFSKSPGARVLLAFFAIKKPVLSQPEVNNLCKLGLSFSQHYYMLMYLFAVLSRVRVIMPQIRTMCKIGRSVQGDL